MSDVVVLTICTEAQARSMQAKLQYSAINFAESWTKLQQRVNEAMNSNAWQVLGYKSWTAFLSDTLAGQMDQLASDDRQRVIELLSTSGMSTRAIAPMVGVTQQAVSKVTTKLSRDLPVDHVPTVETLQNITGIDGKQYAKPERKTPNRRALTAVAKDIGWDLRKVVDRLDRIRADDRFAANKDEIAGLLRGQLLHAVDKSQSVLTDIEPLVTPSGIPVPEGDDPFEYESACHIDPSGGVNSLKQLLAGWDKFLTNYYTNPSRSQLNVIADWLAKHGRKTEKATKSGRAQTERELQFELLEHVQDTLKTLSLESVAAQITTPNKKVLVRLLDDARDALIPARRPGATDWSHQIQAISASIPMETLTQDELLELRGAVEFLHNYTKGELITRKKKTLEADQGTQRAPSTGGK